jgi:hypothetical protein
MKIVSRGTLIFVPVKYGNEWVSGNNLQTATQAYAMGDFHGALIPLCPLCLCGEFLTFQHALGRVNWKYRGRKVHSR